MIVAFNDVLEGEGEGEGRGRGRGRGGEGRGEGSQIEAKTRISGRTESSWLMSMAVVVFIARGMIGTCTPRAL